MHVLSVRTSIRFAMMAFLLLGCPAIVWAHPGHGGFGAGEHDHAPWLVDGILHSLIAMPVMLASLLLAVVTVVRPSRRWESLGWLGAAALGCAVAAFHMSAEWSMGQQMVYLAGSAVGATGWFVFGRVTGGIAARVVAGRSSAHARG